MLRSKYILNKKGVKSWDIVSQLFHLFSHFPYGKIRKVNTTITSDSYIIIIYYDRVST